MNPGNRPGLCDSLGDLYQGSCFCIQDIITHGQNIHEAERVEDKPVSTFPGGLLAAVNPRRGSTTRFPGDVHRIITCQTGVDRWYHTP